MTITAQLQRSTGTITALGNGRHTWQADVATTNGGGDAAPDPHDLLDSALAACTALTLELVARRKGWAVTRIDVQIDRQESPGHYQLTRRIHIEGDLTEPERQRLLEMADRCPIHRLLSGDIAINTDPA